MTVFCHSFSILSTHLENFIIFSNNCHRLGGWFSANRPRFATDNHSMGKNHGSSYDMFHSKHSIWRGEAFGNFQPWWFVPELPLNNKPSYFDWHPAEFIMFLLGHLHGNMGIFLGWRCLTQIYPWSSPLTWDLLGKKVRHQLRRVYKPSFQKYWMPSRNRSISWLTFN